MTTNEANVGKWETQLKKWGKKLDGLVVKAEKARTNEKAALCQNLNNLKEKYQVAQGRLEELKIAGHEKWENLEVGVEHAWDEFSSAFKNLTHENKRGENMIWAIAIIFILLWALGLATSITISGFIHLFLVAAVAMVIIRVIQIRRASKLKTIS